MIRLKQINLLSQAAAPVIRWLSTPIKTFTGPIREVKKHIPAFKREPF
jgi:hypothetical protein